jgi:hypothetical protein
MKRPGLIVATVGTLLAALAVPAWHANTLSDRPPARTDTEEQARSADALHGSAGWRYRHAQPSHWRGCLLQR